MNIEQYREWFHRVANDLDPDGEFTRPRLVSYIMQTAFDANQNIISICESSLFGHSIESAIAHELRHWWQYNAGKISFFIQFGNECTGDWDGITVSKLCLTHEDYCQLPWEKDANEYAAEVCTRLLNRSAA